MQAHIAIFIFLCVSSSTNSKPSYQYSFYLSSPGHYQTLAVRDGEVINSDQPFLPQQPINPGSRNGRNFPGFSHQNPTVGRGYHESNPSIPIGRRYPTGPNPGGYDFGNAQNYPNTVNTPNGELDPIFSSDGQIPQGQNGIYPYQDRGLNGNDFGYNQFGGFQPRYQQPGYQGPLQYDLRNQGILSHQANIKREAEETLKIDKTTTTPNLETTTLAVDGEREEVSTKASCRFCGINKVNPMDEIEGASNPEAEPIGHKNVKNPNNFLIPSNVSPPYNVPVSPGYPVNAPVIRYYVVL